MSVPRTPRRPGPPRVPVRPRPPASARPPQRPRSTARPPTPPALRHFIDEPRATLLDLVDNILNKGLMITGDVVLSLADVDLVYLRISALLAAADKVLPGSREP